MRKEKQPETGTSMLTVRAILARILIFTFHIIYGIKSYFLCKKYSRFSPNVILSKPYQHQKILLIALYEQYALRHDIQTLLTLAKKLNYYVIGVNTATLSNPQDIEDCFDCYIERYNIGRDFGSYQAGFQYIFEKGYHTQCPRLLMLNDSVFYESTRLPAFLEAMMDPQIDILGATENFHAHYHLGSFCIAINHRILCHPNYMKFWSQYKNSEVRPVVIRRGEIALTQCLQNIAEGEHNIKALYSTVFMLHSIETNHQALDTAFMMTCDSGRKKRLIATDVWADFIAHYYTHSLPITEPSSEYYSLYNIDSMKDFFTQQLHIQDEKLAEKMRHFLCAKLMDAFQYTSQIHTNSAFLLHLGLPIIKLDGFFRGFFSPEDLLNIFHQMNPTEAKALEKLLLRRSYGAKTLSDLDRLKYKTGFL